MEPVIRDVTVKAPPERAFHAFTTAIGQWWPREHSLGELVDVVLEPTPAYQAHTEESS